jgi:hypothetical protein
MNEEERILPPPLKGKFWYECDCGKVEERSVIGRNKIKGCIACTKKKNAAQATTYRQEHGSNKSYGAKVDEKVREKICEVQRKENLTLEELRQRFSTYNLSVTTIGGIVRAGKKPEERRTA